jgi:23S rRNA pseudouridine1911/1915/1917 synthase
MNLPVVGDPLYGGASRVKTLGDFALRQRVGHLNRQFLHAWRLGFEHPNGTAMLFQAALPSELQGILNYLEEKYNYQVADLDVPLYAGQLEKTTDENR